MRVLGLIAIGLVTASESEIRIVTDPPGAEVWQGDLRLGTTSREGLRILYESPGTAIYSIRKPGWATVEKTVRLELREDPLTVVVRLQPVAAEPGAAPIESMAEAVKRLQRDGLLGTNRVTAAVPQPQLVDRRLPPPDASTKNVRDGEGIPASVATLIGLLESPDRKIRESAVVKLGRMGPDAKDSVPGLVTSLQDRSWQVRMHAAEALGQIGPGAEAAVSALLEATKDRHIATSIKAGRAIERIGVAALPALKAAMQSPDSKIRKEAAAASRKILRKSAP